MMEQDLKRVLNLQKESIQRTVSAETLLSLLLAGKILKQDELSDFQTVPTEQRIDFLFDKVQSKNNDTIKAFICLLDTHQPQLVARSTRKTEHTRLIAESPDLNQVKNWRDAKIRPVSLYATFGPRRQTSRYSGYSGKEQRPASLRSNPPREREDIRFFFKDDTQQPMKDNKSQNKNMAYETHDSRRSSHDQQQSEYDRLRDQCMYAMNELETLRRKHQEIVNRCDLSVQEADYYRKQHKAVLAKCDQLVREAHALRAQYDHALTGKAKLQQDYEEIVLLREREKMEKENASYTSTRRSSIDTNLDDSNNSNNENSELREEGLREKLDDIQVDYAIVTSKLNKLDEESAKASEKYELLGHERDVLAMECDELRRQCTTAIREYDKALRERDEAIQSSLKADQKLKTALKESEMNYRMRHSKEISKLQDERNAALNEYRLVMSERDSVHRDIEKLQDDLANSQKMVTTHLEEKEKIQHEAECLRQEINTVLIDRDQAVKESYGLKERLEETIQDRDNILKKFEELRQEFEMKKQERDAARKERSEAISHRDKILKECFEVKQLFESPIENIEKHNQLLKCRFEALSKELTEAWKAAEVAMLRRDFAFKERNKIVREKQELGDKCNLVVAERDRITDELFTMQNKYEVLRTQYSKALRELISIKRCRDVNLIKADGLDMRVSTDSAIDTESNEYELETVELERTSKDEDFGFTIGGGIESPLDPHDLSIFVTEVVQDGIAAGKLRVSDCLLKVNEIDLLNVSSQFANQALQAPNFISLSILRKRQCRQRTAVQRVKLIRTEDKELGLSIDSGLHIKRIEPGSIAAEDETLSIGDKILIINGSQIENIPYKDARTLLKRSIVSLTILKASASTASSHRSLANPLIEQDKESETRSYDAEKSQSSPFFLQRNRCPSASVSMPSKIPEYPGSLHSRRSSVMSGSSISSQTNLSPDRARRNTITESERLKFLRDINQLDEILRENSDRASYAGRLSEGQLSDIERDDRLRGHRSAWPPSPPSQPHRSNSYMSAVVSPRAAYDSASNEANLHSDTNSRLLRPSSAPGSRVYVNSRRTDLLLQNGTSPRRISNWPDSAAQGYSLPKNVGRQMRRQRPMLPSTLYNTLQNTSKSVGYQKGRSYSDSEPRHGDPLSLNQMRIGRGHYKSTSSHASSNSSVSSGFTNSHSFIKPVYEEDPREGEQRIVVIEKGIYPLGISIGEGTKGGVFVTMVNENSVAAAAGLQYGDQLLEFNGINLRSATHEQAALILKQSADTVTVTVLAQYNPHKLMDTEEPGAKSSQEESSQSTPKQKRKSTNASVISSHTKQNSVVSTATTVPTYEQPCEDTNPHEETPAEEARQVTFKKPTASTLLGTSIIGGNAVGIFISEIEKECIAALQGGLRIGDRILKLNGASFVSKTAEQAMLELGKPSETVQMLVQYDFTGFRKSQEQAGDSFYVRALFDRTAHSKEELSFKKGDILFVVDTLYQGKLGVWKAWLVSEDDEQQKKEHGTIPSKTKAEQEVLLRRCSVYSDDKMKMRHSFFRRSKKGSHGYSISHSRESSDSRGDEAGSSIGSNSMAFANDADLPAYQPVQRLDSHYLRPVVVLGPHAEPVCDKLVMEWPYKFARALPEMVRSPRESVEKDVESGLYIDFSLSRRGSFACITQSKIKDVMQKSKHCLLDVNPTSLERLIPLGLHPIVILLKYKSHKQIRELRDGHYIREKINSKEAKDLFEQNTKFEKEFKHHIAAVISGNTLNSICSQLNERVQEEQAKPLWVDDELSKFTR